MAVRLHRDESHLEASSRPTSTECSDMSRIVEYTWTTMSNVSFLLVTMISSQSANFSFPMYTAEDTIFMTVTFSGNRKKAYQRYRTSPSPEHYDSAIAFNLMEYLRQQVPLTLIYPSLSLLEMRALRFQIGGMQMLGRFDGLDWIGFLRWAFRERIMCLLSLEDCTQIERVKAV